MNPKGGNNIFILAALLFVPGCWSRCENVTFITFNTGLTTYVPKYSSRGKYISEALTATDADVVCLQEVWYEHDMAAILERTKGKYSNSFSPIHFSVNNLRNPKPTLWQRLPLVSRIPDQPCSLWEGTKLGACLVAFCLKAKSDVDLLKCYKEKCPSVLKGISSNCRVCLFISSSSKTDALKICGNFWGNYNRLNPTGLLVLSKYAIIDAKNNFFLPETAIQFLPRGYLQVQIKNVNVGQVICTHLSANLGEYLEFYLDYGSYENQQKAEIQSLLTTFGGTKHVLLGGLNTGPVIENRGVEGEFPANYDLLVKSGYVSPYVNQVGNCTFCGKSNPLINPQLIGGEPHDVIIDHVMARNISQAKSQRILETLGEETLSDHYGVQVTGCF